MSVQFGYGEKLPVKVSPGSNHRESFSAPETRFAVTRRRHFERALLKGTKRDIIFQWFN